jgi:IS5 family transposase
MWQTTLSDIEYGNRKKKTKREMYLEQMEEIVPWAEIYSLFIPCYDTGANEHGGRKRIPLEIMVRMYLVSCWFSLSDPGTEDAIYDSYAIRSFVGVNFNDPSRQAPDETCLCKFRHMIEENKVGEKIETLIKEKLDISGLIMHGGTILDATILSAAKSTKNEKQERDPEMGYTKKGKNHYFGSKLHIGVDKGTGYIHSHTTTAANVHDINEAHNNIRKDDDTVCGDSGYLGLQEREEIKNDPDLSTIEYEIVKRPSRLKKFKGEDAEIEKAWEIEIEHSTISKRQKVEYPFHIMKNIFGYKKTQYKGLTKNDNKNCVMCALTNLYMMARAGRSFEPLPSMR